jgi:uncharacterized protein (UPF0212 family)
MRKPMGVSVGQVTCPACGEVIKLPMLIESGRRALYVNTDVEPLQEHIREHHAEVAR